jgi:hypothetical protein
MLLQKEVTRAGVLLFMKNLYFYYRKVGMNTANQKNKTRWT